MVCVSPGNTTNILNVEGPLEQSLGILDFSYGLQSRGKGLTRAMNCLTYNFDSIHCNTSDVQDQSRQHILQTHTLNFQSKAEYENPMTDRKNGQESKRTKCDCSDWSKGWIAECSS